MKPRDERQKVMIRARMRVGASWHDLCILNVSRRGLGIQAAIPLPRGTYVEICRGLVTVVARVMWSRGHRAGLQAQDAIAIQALIREPSAAAAAQPALPSGASADDRRRKPRTVQQAHERSRLVARAMEMACMVFVAAAMAFAAFGAVEDALASPLEQIRVALG